MHAVLVKAVDADFIFHFGTVAQAGAVPREGHVAVFAHGVRGFEILPQIHDGSDDVIELVDEHIREGILRRDHGQLETEQVYSGKIDIDRSGHQIALSAIDTDDGLTRSYRVIFNGRAVGSDHSAQNDVLLRLDVEQEVCSGIVDVVHRGRVDIKRQSEAESDVLSLVERPLQRDAVERVDAHAREHFAHVVSSRVELHVQMRGDVRGVERFDQRVEDTRAVNARFFGRSSEVDRVDVFAQLVEDTVDLVIRVGSARIEFVRRSDAERRAQPEGGGFGSAVAVSEREVDLRRGVAVEHVHRRAHVDGIGVDGDARGDRREDVVDYQRRHFKTDDGVLHAHRAENGSYGAVELSFALADDVMQFVAQGVMGFDLDRVDLAEDVFVPTVFFDQLALFFARERIFRARGRKLFNVEQDRAVDRGRGEHIVLNACHCTPSEGRGAVRNLVAHADADRGDRFALFLFGERGIRVHGRRYGLIVARPFVLLTVVGIEQIGDEFVEVDVVLTEQATLAVLVAEQRFFQHILQVDDIVEVLQGVCPQTERAQVEREQIVIDIQADENVFHAVDVAADLNEQVGRLGIVEIQVHGDVEHERGHVHLKGEIDRADDVFERDTRGNRDVARDQHHQVGEADLAVIERSVFHEHAHVERERDPRVEERVDQTGKYLTSVFFQLSVKVERAFGRFRSEDRVEFAAYFTLIRAEQL